MNAQRCTEELEDAMVIAEAAYVENPDPAIQNSWLHKHRDYELRLLDLTKKRML